MKSKKENENVDKLFKNFDDIFDRKNYPTFREVNSKDKLAYTILPEDYSKCLCLSGKKFKFCCKDKFNFELREVLNGTRKVDKDKVYSNKAKKSLSSKVEEKSIDKKIYHIV